MNWNSFDIHWHLFFCFIYIYTYRNNKFGADDTTSRDSDSLIQEYINVPPTDLYTHCWNHPKIRENWRTVLAAVFLLIIGVGLLTMGIFSIANPENGSRGFVFLLAGTIYFKWFVFFPYTLPQNIFQYCNKFSVCVIVFRFYRIDLLYTWCLSCSVYLACSYRISWLQFLSPTIVHLVSHVTVNDQRKLIHIAFLLVHAFNMEIEYRIYIIFNRNHKSHNITITISVHRNNKAKIIIIKHEIVLMVLCNISWDVMQQSNRIESVY